MKKNLKLFVALLLFPLSLSAQKSVQGEGVQFITEEKFENILQKAKNENKNIFIDCYAVWCGPCKRLSKEVFPQKTVGVFLNNHFINVKYNTEKGEGLEFYRSHQDAIQGLPTMLIVSPDGEIIHSIVGFRTSDELLNEVQMALDGKTLTSLEKRYKNGERELDLVKDYVAALKSAYKTDKVKSVVDDYRANLPVESLLDPDIWNMSKEFIVDPYSPDYQFVIINLYKYEIRLKENVAALKRQLYRGLKREVNHLLPELEKQNIAQATLDSVSILKSILEKNVMSESPDMIGKFKIAEYIRENNPKELFNFISFAHDVNLYRNDVMYLQKVYQYICENINDEEMLKTCLNRITKLQLKENETSLPVNFYATIALINKKLGDENGAKDAQSKYEVLEERMQKKLEKLKEIFTKNEE